MKKIKILVLGIISILLLTYLAIQLSAKKGVSDEKVAAFNFAIKDTSSIDKVIITDPNGVKQIIKRQSKFVWTDGKGGCIQSEPVKNILEAALNIRFKGYIPDNSIKNVTNQMATLGTKVEFFVNGEWSKTWYIGSSTPDHYGTYMLIESEEYGKSDLPVIAEINGVKGIIGPRFFTDSRRWECSELFQYDPLSINKVEVKYLDNSGTSFEINKKQNSYSVSSNGRKLNTLDTTRLYKYLMNFKRINYEYKNYDLSPKQVDSLKRSKPFCLFSVKDTKGNQTKLKLYHMKPSEEEFRNVDDFGNKVNYDPVKLWCVRENGELVKCQYFVMTPLIVGQIFFDFNK